MFYCFQDCYCYSNRDVSCDKTLQRDCTALYSVAGHGLYTQFTRPFPPFVEVGQACETNVCERCISPPEIVMQCLNNCSKATAGLVQQLIAAYHVRCQGSLCMCVCVCMWEGLVYIMGGAI